MNVRRKLRQKCVYWELKESNTEGQPDYDLPVELPCRIVKDHLQVDKEGRTLISQTQVNTEQELIEGSIVYLGSWQNLADAYPDADPSFLPFKTPNCWEVRHTSEVPDLKARRFWRTAYL